MKKGDQELIMFKKSKYLITSQVIEEHPSDRRLNKRVLYSTRAAKGILVTQHVVGLFRY